MGKKLFCGGCFRFFNESDSYIVDPNIKTPGGLAATFHPTTDCYPHLGGGVYRDKADKVGVRGPTVQEKKSAKVVGSRVKKHRPESIDEEGSPSPKKVNSDFEIFDGDNEE